MANIDFAALSGNARVSAVLHQTIQAKLADKASLWRHPAISYFGTLAGSGSSALQVPVVGLAGTDVMASVADGSSVANTSITASAATITIARQALRYDLTDLAKLTNPIAGGMGVGIEGLAESIVTGAEMRFTSMICGLASGISTSVGSTGVDLSVATFYSAIYSLQLTANDPVFMAVLHPQQINDLMNSLRSEAGPGQYLAATQDQVNAKGPGYRGSLFGVDLFSSTKIPTANAGADYAGMMFSKGFAGYADGTPAPVQGAGGLILPAGTPIVVELERDASAALTKIVGSYYVGVAEIEDARAVQVISDF